MRVTYTVDKSKVLKEVGRLTAYVASRKKEDEGAAERIPTTDSDKEMLEQFWTAACSAATDELMHFSRRIDNDSDSSQPCYEVVMEMSSLYDTQLNESVEDSLRNFFVNLITSKWCNISSPDDAPKFTAEALGYMKDVERKIYNRKRPTRTNKEYRRDELLPSISTESSGS